MEIPTHDTARDACSFALKRVRLVTVSQVFGDSFERPGFVENIIAATRTHQDVRTVSPISHSTGYGFHLAAFPVSLYPTPGEVRAILMRDDVRPSLDDWGTCAAALFSILSGVATIGDAMARIRYALDDDDEPADLVGIQSHGFETIEEIEVSVLEILHEFPVLSRAYATRTKAASRVLRLGSLPGNPRGGLCSMGKRIFPEAMAWQDWDTVGRLIDGRPRVFQPKPAGVDLIQLTDSTECPVCLDTEPRTRRLRCGHSVGDECLHKIAETTGSIRCPLCRAPHPVAVRCVVCNDSGLVFLSGCCGAVVCARCCSSLSRRCASCLPR